VSKIFEAIDTYQALLRSHSNVFTASYADEEDFLRQFKAWSVINQSSLESELSAQRKYLVESFAQAALCGAILQIAAKAIECYSQNTKIPTDWERLIKPETKAVPFCIGRLIRGVPLGLVVYAARNQHTHFEVQKLREPSLEVFQRLATRHGYGTPTADLIYDPAFTINMGNIASFAGNVTALLEWRSLEVYERDMRQLLSI
jgi:hypothetical protein